MDFWTDGLLEDVVIYVHSRQPVNEEVCEEIYLCWVYWCIYRHHITYTNP